MNEKTEDGYTWTTQKTWRVIPMNPFTGVSSYFVYDEKEAEILKGDPEVKEVWGPFEQWTWIRENNISYVDLCKFDDWARGLGINPGMLGRAVTESVHNLIKQWWEEK